MSCRWRDGQGGTGEGNEVKKQESEKGSDWPGSGEVLMRPVQSRCGGGNEDEHRNTAQSRQNCQDTLR